MRTVYNMALKGVLPDIFLRVLSVTPADNSTYNFINTSIVITFSKDVHYDYLRYIVLKNGFNVIGSSKVVTANIVTITPLENLPVDTKIDLYITMNIRGLYGEKMVFPYNSCFYTGDEVGEVGEWEKMTEEEVFFISGLTVKDEKIYSLKLDEDYGNPQLIELQEDNTWLEVGDVCSTDGGRKIVNCNDVLYFIGYDGAEDTDDLYEYDGTDTWVKRVSFSSGFYFNDMIVFNDKIYATTFYEDDTFKLYELDTTEWEWVEKADTFMLEGMTDFALLQLFNLLVINNNLYTTIFYYEYSEGLTKIHYKLLRWNGTNSWVLETNLGNFCNFTLDFSVPSSLTILEIEGEPIEPFYFSYVNSSNIYTLATPMSPSIYKFAGALFKWHTLPQKYETNVIFNEEGVEDFYTSDLLFYDNKMYIILNESLLYSKEIV